MSPARSMTRSDVLLKSYVCEIHPFHSRPKKKNHHRPISITFDNKRDSLSVFEKIRTDDSTGPKCIPSSDFFPCVIIIKLESRTSPFKSSNINESMLFYGNSPFTFSSFILNASNNPVSFPPPQPPRRDPSSEITNTAPRLYI